MLLSMLLLCLPAPQARANELVLDDVAPVEGQLGLYLHYLADESGELRAGDVLHNTSLNWRRAADSSATIGPTRAVHWFILHFSTAALADPGWVLSIENAMLQHIEIYLYRDNVLLQRELIGSNFPFSQRKLQRSQPSVPLQLQPHQHYQLLFRVDSGVTFDFPVYLVPQSIWLDRQSEQQIFVGIYFGMVFIMMLYNAFLFFSTRIFAYLWYVLYIGSIGILLAALDGSAFQFLWPQVPWLNRYSLGYADNSATLFAALFTSSLLDTRNLSPFLHRLLQMIACAAIVGYLITLMLPQGMLLLIYVSVLSFIAYLTFFCAGVIAWSRGNIYARYFTLAWAALCFISVWFSVAALFVGRFEANEVWGYVRLASMVEMMLLAFALAARINVTRSGEQQARADSQAKSDLIAQVSHELRAPLNGIIGIAELQRDLLTGEAVRSYNKIILDSGDMLLRVINDLQDSARLDANKLVIETAPFDVRSLANDVMAIVASLAAGKQLTLETDIAADVPRCVIGDAARVRQILINFLSNAVKFTLRGSVRLCIVVDGNRLRFDVIDTGIGLSAQAREQLFKPFSQIKHSLVGVHGTGLGLHICARLARLMDGAVGVQSQPGRGSTFWLALPLVASAAPAPAVPAPVAVAKPLRVLVADDNSVNQLVITRLLKKHANDVTLVTDGDQALQTLLAQHQSYDLVLMDCEMPERDGYSATREIRSQEKARGLLPKPIVALTAHSLESFHQRCFDAGMNEILTKPVREQELLALLARYA